MGCLASLISFIIQMILYFFFVCGIFLFLGIILIGYIIKKLYQLYKKKKSNYNKYVDNSINNYKPSKTNKFKNTKGNINNKNIKIIDMKNDHTINKNINNSEVYLKIYIKKKYKELLKKDTINLELLNINSYDAPMILYEEYDEISNYYVFEAWESSSEKYGNLLEKLYQYCNDDFYATISYDDKYINYKFTSINNIIYLNNKNITELTDHYQSLKHKINTFSDKLYEYFNYIEDQDFYDKVVPNDELDCDSISILSDKLNKTTSILIYEIPYLEEISTIIDIIEPKIIKEYEIGYKRVMDSLPDIEIIDEPDEESFVEKEYKKEKELSWEEEKFEREADLWGLSEEDRRIAKEERMTPAEFIEAEEYDDDELLKDEWER